MFFPGIEVNKKFDYTMAFIEAMGLLSSSKLKKNERERVREIVKGLCEALNETKHQLEELEKAGLGVRDKRKLSRLESIYGRIVNIQVCEDCKSHFDSILEESTKYV